MCTETPIPPLTSPSPPLRRMHCEILENTAACVGMARPTASRTRLLPPFQERRHPESLTGMAAAETSPCRRSCIHRSHPYYRPCGISHTMNCIVRTEPGTTCHLSRHHEPRFHKPCDTTATYGNLPLSFLPSPPHREWCRTLYPDEDSLAAVRARSFQR